MPMSRSGNLIREHPVFFWGILLVIILLLLATGWVARRIPEYRQTAAEYERELSTAERATRDRLLASSSQRAELTIALIQREHKLRAVTAKGLHLAINLSDSTLSLRHGPATLRKVPVHIGSDSVIQASDGRTWRFVHPLGERSIVSKAVAPVYTIPEWVYVSRGDPVPPEAERRVEAGLGRYVLNLEDGVAIYSTPERGPLREGTVPASFRVRESDLASIFDAVPTETPVFIY
jgi:hypothetical protein